LSQKFFGEYTELVVEVSAKGKPETIVIHTNPGNQLLSDECWFKLEDTGVRILEI
jgi:hypothetical protein